MQRGGRKKQVEVVWLESTLTCCMAVTGCKLLETLCKALLWPKATSVNSIIFPLCYEYDRTISWHFCCLVISHVWLFCDSTDCSSPGSSVRGISQPRILEWVAISFSKGSSWPRDWTRDSCIGSSIFFFFYHWATREAPYHGIICVINRWEGCKLWRS